MNHNLLQAFEAALKKIDMTDFFIPQYNDDEIIALRSMADCILSNDSFDHKKAHLIKGEILSWDKKYDSALSHFRLARNLSSQEISPTEGYANSLYYTNNYQEAVQILESLHAKNKTDVFTTFKLSYAFLKSGKTEKAMETFAECISDIDDLTSDSPTELKEVLEAQQSLAMEYIATIPK